MRQEEQNNTLRVSIKGKRERERKFSPVLPLDEFLYLPLNGIRIQNVVLEINTWILVTKDGHILHRSLVQAE